MKLRYQVRKIEGYTLEPLFDKDGAAWQSHHVTNPTLIRISLDERAYLGYRAGGDRDHYCLENGVDCFSSSLGLAVLNETASAVLFRFPLPILRVRRSRPLPQSLEEYGDYMEKHGNDISVMHDFRLYEHEGYLYVIYHDGSLKQAFDCIRRMPLAAFKQRVDRSIGLAGEPADQIRTEWETLWWAEDTWEVCGVDGGRLLFPMVDGRASGKTDVVYYELAKRRIQLMRRPVPDITVLDTDDSLRGKRTIEGDQEYGVVEQGIRPGYFDNSHVGPNGTPTRAVIGGREVYIDVCHGVHNPALAEEGSFYWAMTYSPYFRVKDAATGDLLYYSDEPIMDPDDPMWEEYTRRGRWIQALTHHYITFAGGQLEMNRGQNGVDDPFTFFTGVGDTAIARAEFTIRELLPPAVLTDIAAKAAHEAVPASLPEREYRVPERAAGWEWIIRQDAEKRGLAVARSLAFPNGTDRAVRRILPRPGYFDADFLLFDDFLVRRLEGMGYVLLYRGLRWLEEDGRRLTRGGWGILLLDDENLERILYRSWDSEVPTEDWEGFVLPEGTKPPKELWEQVEDVIPAQVRFEIHRARELAAAGAHWRSQHTIWLENRAKKLRDTKL